MQVDQDVAYRLAYETANFELTLIQGAMKKLQREKERVENALAASKPLPITVH
jgi:hypothetical protein